MYEYKTLLIERQMGSLSEVEESVEEYALRIEQELNRFASEGWRMVVFDLFSAGSSVVGRANDSRHLLLLEREKSI